MKPFIQIKSFAVAVVSCAIFVGCAKTRSISNSGYFEPGHHRVGSGVREFAYHGELSEFDVLGIQRDRTVSDEEINRALDNAKQVRLEKDASILLIQSGAAFPDGAIVSALSQHFRVTPFSGIPPEIKRSEQSTPGSFAQSLRLAAARSGSTAIVCYWGILESTSENLATKTVSWVPVLNWVVPDERQNMRIRLKLAVIDVRTGNWTVFSPEPLVDKAWSTGPRRGTVDQKQVESLKQKAYEVCAKELIRTRNY